MRDLRIMREFQRRIKEYISDRFVSLLHTSQPDVDFMSLVVLDVQGACKQVIIHYSTSCDAIKRQIDKRLTSEDSECSIFDDFHSKNKPNNGMVDCIQCGNMCCEYCFFDIIRRNEEDKFVCPFCRDVKEPHLYGVDMDAPIGEGEDIYEQMMDQYRWCKSNLYDRNIELKAEKEAEAEREAKAQERKAQERKAEQEARAKELELKKEAKAKERKASRVARANERKAKRLARAENRKAK